MAKSPLNQDQKRFFKAAKWFYGGSRGSGRSYVAAVTLLRIAMNNPGQSFYLYDPSLIFHYGTNFALHSHFARRVKTIALERYPEATFSFSVVNHSITFEGYNG